MAGKGGYLTSIAALLSST